MLQIIIDTIPFLDQLSWGCLQEHLQAGAASCTQVNVFKGRILSTTLIMQLLSLSIVQYICIILSDEVYLNRHCN